ncbi:MAG: HAD family phosphatase [Lachnospiraceae bacterium]|jgi:HAD superfamily hydrolase (TIGR01509 family)|nr:HAD family phosphatase [Lachnospiraceae bacterium]
MPNKSIIFDMDGVIFDTENLFLGCWREIAAEQGLAGIDEVYRRVIGVKAEISRAVFLETYGADFAYDELNGRALKMFHAVADSEGIPMKPGVVPLLNHLRKDGFTIGLASSTRAETVRKQLGDSGLLGYFHAVVGGDMVENSKPAPDIFLAACEQIGAVPAETYVVEDSYNGVRAAHAAGMKVIMVPDIVMPDEEMRGLAGWIFPSLVELLEFFSKNACN